VSCAFPKCSKEDVLTYLTKPLCQKHWEFVCDHKEDALKKLNLKVSVRQEGIVAHEDREMVKVMNKAAEHIKGINLDKPS